MYIPTHFVGPDEVNVNVVPRRGMHLPRDENPYSRGQAAANPETEEASRDLVLIVVVFNSSPGSRAHRLQHATNLRC